MPQAISEKDKRRIGFRSERAIVVLEFSETYAVNAAAFPP
jgi:hypothetical protein